MGAIPTVLTSKRVSVWKMWRTVALVACAGCGRLDFADHPSPSQITTVRPGWTTPGGGTVDIALTGDPTAGVPMFDGIPCESPTYNTPDSITCIAPPHAPASVAVTVTSDGGETTTSAKRFVYLATGIQQLGGPLDDRTSGIAIDPDGNVVISGATTGSLDGPNAGDFDALTVKYDASGSVAWIRQLGTPLFDYARDVAIDPSGAITIAGYTAGSLGGANAGSNDAFVARYTPDGTLAWVAQTGSSGDDQVWDLGVDRDGNTVVAVQTTGSLGGPNAGGQDLAVARYRPTGELAWVKQTGTAGDDFGHSVAVAADGTAFVVGYTSGSLSAANAGGLDLVAARYEPDGTQTWIRQRGGAGDEQATDALVDPATGDLWIAGVTTAAFDGTTSQGGTDIFATSFDAAGTWKLTRQFGGTGSESSFGIAPAPDGHVYLECTTTAAFDGQAYAGGANDLCMIALDRAGSRLWTSIAGSPGTDQASSCAFDPALTGMIYESLITNDSLDGMPNRGGNDIAFARFDSTGALR